MFSADLMADDPLATAAVLVERLGLPALRESWTDAVWPGPEVEVQTRGELSYAFLQPSMRESAGLELVASSNEAGRHGAFFAEWGPGPHAIRLGVNGLAAKARDLEERDTPFVEAETPSGEPVLVVGGDTLGGAIFEFAEDSDWLRG